MSSKPRVFVTRSSKYVVPAATALLAETCEVIQWSSDADIPRADLLRMISGMDGVYLQIWDKVDKELLDAAGPSLKCIGTNSVGFDHIDLEECRKRKIRIGYTPNVLTSAVAEMTVALLFCVQRRLVVAGNVMRQQPQKPLFDMMLASQGWDLCGKVVGIFGFGRIGSSVGKKLSGFDLAKLQYFDVADSPVASQLNAERVDLDTFLATSDIIAICAAMTGSTRGMFNKDAFSKMKDGVILINTSRGPLVDLDDLHDSLKSGKVRAAGLDVTEPEPLPPTHPLLHMPNVLIAPHISSTTLETRTNMGVMTSRNILAGLAGKEMVAELK